MFKLLEVVVYLFEVCLKVSIERVERVIKLNISNIL